MNEATLAGQVAALIAENHRLRTKSIKDDDLIGVLKQQYDDLAAEMDGIRDFHARQTRALQTERDKAVRMFTEIDGLLLQATDLIMQALRARKGDDTPEKMPQAITPHLNDDRLPIACLS